MDSARFARIEALFHAALERAPLEREAFLSANESDADVLAEVHRLLDRQANDSAFLHSALNEAAALTPAVESQIGPYRVIGELGAGGMGTVLLAERLLGDTRQRVALKLIRGMPTATARERFARERAMLVELNHPNIARLIDAGETAERVPYLAMEYIDGLPLLHYCSARGLDLPARLRLFAPICRAVQHAHQHLIVHRDIKPANILIRNDGTPMLLDFGIGKLLSPTQGDETSTQVFTPTYAAPEQRTGHGVTTAADVYGLGCVLYELLSERSLKDVRDGDRMPPPSAAAQDPLRARLLRGDADTMVAKALHVDPEQRYASAGAFADDIERYLAGQPVLAHAPSGWYRTRKFIQRHRSSVAATAVLVIAVFAALGLALWEAGATRREIKRANALHDFMVTAFQEAEPSVPREGPPRITEVVDQAIAKARGDARLNPGVRTELLSELGAVLRNQGRMDSARQTLQWNYDQALKQLGTDSPLTIEAGRELAVTLTMTGDFAHARTLIDDLLARSSASDPAAQSKLWFASAYLATSQHELKRALSDSRRALDQARTQGDADALAEALSNLGNVQFSAGDIEGAAASTKESLALREHEYGPQHLFVATAHANLSRVYRRQGRLDDAMREIRAALAIDSAVLPKDDWRHARHLNALLNILRQQYDFRAALDTATEALRIDRIAYGDDHPNTLTDLQNVGILKNKLDDYAGAAAALHESLTLTEAKFGAEHHRTAVVRANYAVALAGTGDDKAGEAQLRHAISSLEQAKEPDFDEQAATYEKLAQLKLDAGEAVTALSLIDHIDSSIAKLGKPSAYWDGRSAALRGQAFLISGRLSEAAPALDAAATALAKAASPDPELRIEIMLAQGELAHRLGNETQAHTLAQQASVALKALPTPPRRLLDHAARLAQASPTA